MLIALARHLVRLPLRLIPRTARVRVLTGPLRGARWIAGAATNGAWLGIYERHAQRAFVEHVQAGSIVFDVGANVGFFTLLASRLVGSRGTVVAFEPLPRNLSLLRDHIEMNARTNVVVLPIAVAREDGEARLRVTGNPSMTGLAADGELRIATASIDTLVGEGRIPPPSFMKIDVEAAEHDVLRGALTTLRAHRPVILLSTHGYAVHELCWALLQEEGYAPLLLRDGEVDGDYMILAKSA